MPIQSSLNAAIMNAANTFERMNSIASANSASSAAQAQITRDWQEQQNAKAMAFNQMEAAKTRNWQEYMSNTAHQREVADLKAAGLNPVLSATGGNGAAVTSGATASGVTSSGATGQVDMSMNQALVNLLGSIYNRTTQIEQANINARTQEAVADKYTAMNHIIAQLQSDTSKEIAEKYPSTSTGAIMSILSQLQEDGLGGKIDDAISSAKDAAYDFGKKVGSKLKSAASGVMDWIKYITVGSGG